MNAREEMRERRRCRHVLKRKIELYIKLHGISSPDRFEKCMGEHCN